MKRRYWLFIITVLGLVGVVNLIGGQLSPQQAKVIPSSTAPDFNQVDAYVQAGLKTAGVPGAALAVVHGNQVVHLRAFGVAGPSGQPVTPQTPFMVGSENKSVTALALMQLIEDGKVDLDAPVQQYIPWFQVADASARITIRELLDQTSGISTNDGISYFRLKDASDKALENRVRALRGARLVSAPGATYHYSNANYDILGLVIQTVTRRPYDQYVEEHVFWLVGMTHSTFSPDVAEKNGLAAGYQNVFFWAIPRPHVFNRGMIASGALLSSSAEDWAHFLIAQLNDGRYQMATLLSSQEMAVMHRPGAPMGTANQTYTSGWVHANIDGMPILAHSGDTYTARAGMVLVPGERWGVILLMNEDNSWQVTTQDNLALGAALLLTGHPAPAAFPPNDTYIFAFLLVAILLYTVASSARNAARWLRNPGQRPARAIAVITQLALPLLASLGVAYMMLIDLRMKVYNGLPFADIIFAHADLGYTALVTGALALAWSAAWAALMIKVYLPKENAAAKSMPEVQSIR